MGKEISERDIDAVRYFQENGGLFTICSGRFLPYLEEFFDKVKPNTDVICLNGAIIINPDTKEKRFEGVLDDDALDVVSTVLDSNDSYFSLTLFPYNSKEWIRFSRDEYHQKIAELKTKKYYKCIIVSQESDAIPCGKAAAAHYSERYSIVSSWSESIEILSHDCTKGEAILRLKEATGSKLVVAVGDFENDVSMLRAADISFAPNNACEEAKAAADTVLISPCGGAIAEVISLIENNLK